MSCVVPPSGWRFAWRVEREAPGGAASILEGIAEILTVNRLGLPLELRRSLNALRDALVTDPV